MVRALLVAAAPLLFGLACSGKSESDDGGSNSGATSSAGSSSAGSSSAGSSGSAGSTSGGSGGSGGSPSSSCPSTPPVADSACDVPTDGNGFVTAHCSWGDDVRPHCRTTAVCSQGSWQVTAPDAERCDAGPLPPSCPQTAPASETTCSDPTLECWYDDGTRCRCSPCQGGSEYPLCQPIEPPEWACRTPDARCPVPAPQAGESCEEPDLECGPDCEQTITCRDGVWQWGGGNCPICAAADTLIDTPFGPRPIAELRAGDPVYSVEDGAVVAVPLLLVGSAPVARHVVVRLELDDGGVVEMSPGHPTADGRSFAELLNGGALDERHAVVAAELVPYEHERTHDILPASTSGAYFVGGALVGSTLRPQELGRPSARQRSSASQ